MPSFLCRPNSNPLPRHSLVFFGNILFFILLFQALPTSLHAQVPIRDTTISEKKVQDSSGPLQEKSKLKQKPGHRGITRYLSILTDRDQRDSLLVKLSRERQAPPVPDSILRNQREDLFAAYRGKIIRDIYYNRLDVFGTQIDDTSFNTSMKLVRFANRLHFKTREWMIRQSLFFRENDTVNAYKMVENERYLRNLPFMQDARLYVINTRQDPDSIDILVVTKDVFEYGGNLGNLVPNSVAASVYDNNVAGAGQNLLFGFRWDELYRPQWRTELGYSKYNAGGSFADISVGYSGLNDHGSVDTGVYERSYYLSINRPLYSSWAKFAGGITLAYNQSVNIYSYNDTVFRDYQYRIMDLWGGFNFRTQFKNNGQVSEKPNIAIELREFNLNFARLPSEPIYAKNPNYNDNHYTLGKLVFFYQDFFKTNYFFGFGRTEDIPKGYNFSASSGWQSWVGLDRLYTALEAQKYWLGAKQDLVSLNFGLGGFWNKSNSQDAVLHLQADIYSRLFLLSEKRFRQFLHLDYLTCLNPVLYKPLNINRESGITGFRNTFLNGYQRVNINAQTTFYSPLALYGFRFNFFTVLQGSLLAGNQQSLWKSPFYTGLGLGCAIRNENLSFNTLQISGSYLPITPSGAHSFFFDITTVADIRFNIFAIQEPALIPFR
jgi:hypothetical protein